MINISQDESQFLLFKEVPWMIVFICEAALILAGNFITVYIFWSIRKRLKRTSYLLINLAVADIFVGIGVTLFIGADIAMMRKRSVEYILCEAIIMIDICATVSSMLSLVLISLERMFAILWPFRHRLLQTRYFYVSVGFIWLISAANIISNLRFGSETTAGFGYSIFTATTFIVAVLAISGAYLAIWVSTRCHQMPHCKERRSIAQNRKLAKTLFIMTALSIITYLPYGITIIFNQDFLENLFSFRVQITFVAQYANSFLNPIVYCFRMPAFKASLKKLLCHCTRNKISFEQNYKSASRAVTLTSFKSAVEIS